MYIKTWKIHGGIHIWGPRISPKRLQNDAKRLILQSPFLGKIQWGIFFLENICKVMLYTAFLYMYRLHTSKTKNKKSQFRQSFLRIKDESQFQLDQRSYTVQLIMIGSCVAWWWSCIRVPEVEFSQRPFSRGSEARRRFSLYFVQFIDSVQFIQCIDT